MAIYQITAPAIGKEALGARLRDIFGQPIEVDEVEPSGSKVVIRQASADVVADLQSANLAREFSARRALLSKARAVEEVRDLLGLGSRQTLHNWIAQNKIIALPDNGRLFLPLWQFEANSDDKVVAGLTQTLRALKRKSYSAAHWFTTANPQLGGRTPISLLRAGKVAEVVAEAEQADSVS